MTGERALWCEVLTQAINDALTGIPASSMPDRRKRLKAIEDARAYIYTRDFDIVCSLAGVDSDGARDRLVKLIADAPTPEELLDAGNPRVQKFTALGRSETFAGWSKITGLATYVLRHRAADPSWTPERVVTEPLRPRAVNRG